ncbi:NAD(P)/FAD-dependent oxidoreductase [Candidatus Woesearchaeota archaeon]|nr:NAD(P)/FAD-dependent oxidoreductase [Candidatus Woesearchaeota archaeon]
MKKEMCLTEGCLMMYDSIIVGAGPAGISAAIQMKRAGFTIALFEKKHVGGLVWNANCVENYLGYPKPISGKELAALFAKQLHTWRITPFIETVIKITKRKNTFIIKTNTKKYFAKTVIIATGTTPRTARIPGDKELSGKRIFYEIIDFPVHEKNKSIAIIGGGDVAFDYALQLARKKQMPYILTKKKTTCLKKLKECAKQMNVPLFENISVTSINKNNEDKGKKLLRLFTNNKTFKADFVFIAVGREPTFPQIEYKNAENTKGLFIANVAQQTKQRHIQIACGDGLKIAIQAIEYLQHTQKDKKT